MLPTGDCSNSNANNNISPPSPPHPSSDDLLRFLEIPSFEPLPLAPIPSPPPRSPYLLPPPCPDTRPAEISDPLEDLPFWDFYDGGTLEGSAGDDELIGIDEGDENGGTVVEQTPYATSNDQLFDCSACHVVREVVHCNGVLNAKLEIHGGLGVVYHVITLRYTVDGFPEQYITDLSMQSLDVVKQFLIEYSQSRQREGLFLTHDSMSLFYDAISVRMRDGEASNSTNASQVQVQPVPQPQQNLGLVQAQQLAIPKTGIAAQRERTANLQLSEIADYFHLPIADAARELCICTTALKKICRRFEMSRWPHRKLKSLMGKLAKLEEILRTQTGEAAQRTSAEISEIQEQMTRIREGREE